MAMREVNKFSKGIRQLLQRIADEKVSEGIRTGGLLADEHLHVTVTIRRRRYKADSPVSTDARDGRETHAAAGGD